MEECWFRDLSWFDWAVRVGIVKQSSDVVFYVVAN